MSETDHHAAARRPPWFVVNATEPPWQAAPGWGRFVDFERADGRRFPDYGINIHVLEPGEVSTMYHGEGAQEGFLVLSGTCVLFVEGEEVRLQAVGLRALPARGRATGSRTRATGRARS